MVDDTGIEPVTPTMSILAYAVLHVSSVLCSTWFRHTLSLRESLSLCSSLKGVRQVLGITNHNNRGLSARNHPTFPHL